RRTGMGLTICNRTPCSRIPTATRPTYGSSRVRPPRARVIRRISLPPTSLVRRGRAPIGAPTHSVRELPRRPSPPRAPRAPQHSCVSTPSSPPDAARVGGAAVLRSPPRIAYMTGEYLRLSPFVFIHREVSALRRQGFHVETFTIRGLADSSEAVNDV